MPTGDVGSPPLLAYTEEGRLRPYQSNLVTLLNTDPALKGRVHFNEFTGRSVKTGEMPWSRWEGDGIHEEWTERDAHKLREYIERKYRWSPPPSLILSAVQSAAYDHSIHPLRNHLEKIEWDGTPRLNSWLQTFYEVEDSPYSRAVGRKFMIGAVARIFRPGCKMDTALVLEGKQGIGKSTSLRHLVPWEGLVWDSPLDLFNKDSQLSLLGYWIVEMSELEALNKASVPRVKSFLSLQEDRYRAPFGRHTQVYPRQCVFVGTTNEASYLKDATGGRRFWPVHCQVEEVDLQALAAVRDQLWAEAVHAFKAREIWHLTRNESEFAEVQQSHRTVEHPWTELIDAYIRSKEDVTLMEVLKEALGLSTVQSRSREGTTVAKILTDTFGWRKTKVYRNGIRTSGYIWSDGEECHEVDLESSPRKRSRPMPEVVEEVDSSAFDPDEDDY